MYTNEGVLNHRWKGGTRRNGDGRMFELRRGHYRADQNGYVLKSILLAEKALGKALPPGAQVHHFDGNPANDYNNLVLCENQAYHHLLHKRKRAYKACGNARWLKCPYCKTYDDPKKLYIDPKNNGRHRRCKNAYERERYRTKRTGTL